MQDQHSLNSLDNLPTKELLNKVFNLLVDTFSTTGSLEGLVYQARNKHLDQVATGTNTEIITRRIIIKAHDERWLFDLVKAAQNLRPTDIRYKEIYKQLTEILSNEKDLAIIEKPLAKLPDALFYVPYARNLDFVGRDEELKNLHAAISQSNSPVGIRPTILVGLGGIGKTQLAVEYVHTYRNHYAQGIFWLNATNPLIDEFSALADALGLTEQDTSRESASYKSWEYLNSRTHALVIFDNVIDPYLLNTPFAFGLIPANLRCKTLFTTRQRDFPRSFQSFEVRVLPETPALRLLLRKRQDVLDKNHHEWGVARIICASLGWLPLALELAASYLGQYPEITLSGYLNRLREEGNLPTIDNTELRPEDLPTRHAVAVSATLHTQWIRLKDNDAKQLFLAAGYFPESTIIPRDRLGLLTSIANESSIGKVTPLRKALDKLHNLSLIEELENNHLRLHPLVREFAASLLSDDFCDDMSQRIATALYNIQILERHISQRGIDAILEDIRTGLSLCIDIEKNTVDIIYNQLIDLETVLSHESHNLRISTRGIYSENYYVQQIYNCSIDVGVVNLAKNAITWLRNFSRPYFGLLWRVGSKTPELERTLKGHQDLVTDICVTRHQIISASNDKTIKIWDLHTGREIRTLKGHTDKVVAVTVTPDEQQIVSVSHDKTIRVWDVRTGQEVRTLRGHNDQIRAIDVLSNSQVISASRDRTIKVWDLDTGKVINDLPNISAFAIAVIPSTNHIVLASGDNDAKNSLKLLNLGTAGQAIRSVGHNAIVRSVAVTTDGYWLLSGSEDHTLALFHFEKQKDIYILSGHLKAVNCVAVTLDNLFAVSASDDCTIKVWNLDTKQEVRTLAGHADSVTSIAVTLDSQRIISASADKTIKIWHMKVGQEVPTLRGHLGGLNDVKITFDGLYAISASEDHTIKVWDLTKYYCIHTFKGHTASVNALALTSDGKKVISSSSDCTIRVWSLESRCELYILLGHKEPVNAVTVTPDGQLILSVSNDHTLKIWDTSSGREIYSLSSQTKINDICVTPTGKHAVFGCQDGKLEILDIRTKEARTMYSHKGSVYSTEITSDGKYLVSGSYDGTVKIWSFESDQELYSLTSHLRPVKALAISRNSSYIVSASDDFTCKIWNLETGHELQSFSQNQGTYPRAVDITPDGQRIISASSDSSLRIWNFSQANTTPVFSGHKGPVRSLIMTPDNRYVISASSDKTVKVWNLESGQAIQTFTFSSEVLALAITKDGERVFIASKDGSINIRHLETRKPVIIKGHSREVHSLAITPRGEYVISASLDGTMKVWNSETGLLTRTLIGHNGMVRCVATTLDGQYVISASKDHSLKVWDIDSGQEIKSFLGHGDVVRSLAIAPDSRHVISTSHDRTLKIWDLQSGREVYNLDTKIQISNIAVTSNMNYIVLTHNQEIKILDWKTCKTLTSVSVNNTIECITTASINGRTIVLAGDEAGNINCLEYFH